MDGLTITLRNPLASYKPLMLCSFFEAFFYIAFTQFANFFVMALFTLFGYAPFFTLLYFYLTLFFSTIVLIGDTK